jgi:isoquinoline 1-oxidoreductase beta subunit
MSEILNLSRRGFLKISAAVGGGLLVGFQLPGCERNSKQTALESEAPTRFTPNAWLKIARDDMVTVMVGSSEMGQGVMTAIPMLVAEELEADWSKVHAQQAPADPAYTNPLIGQQLTGGSTTVRAFWTPVREAGATARELLISAAAQTWGVKEARCRAENGVVLHSDSDRRLSYGALADQAATLPVPKAVFLKDPKEFRLLGKSMPRLDTPAKVNGSAQFGQDVRLEGMLVATVARCPVFGGKVVSFDAGAAKAVPGVRHVVRIDAGVAVVADGFWPAKLGRDLLKVEWDEGAHAQLDSASIRARFATAAAKEGVTARNEGDAVKVLKADAKKLEAVYEVPYLAHACMEPMNCTAHVRKDGCDIWVPTQAQAGVQKTAARITGLPAESIRVHTTFLGGGFGRRSEQDFVAEAVQVSKAVGSAVQVMWTREDDTRHDYYRPATYNRLSATLGKNGLPSAWTHHIVGPSIMARVFPSRVKEGIDPTSVEGASNLPYAIPNIRVTYTLDDPGVPVGFWRSVGSSQNAFITECFLDELAARAQIDPYQYRRKLLAGHARHLGVLDLAADKAGWTRPLPKGRYRGIALAESFGAFVAQVAEISFVQGALRVHRVVCAVDCGLVVNPDTVEAQMQSAIVYGLTAALKGEITIRKGRVEQGNFNDYPLLRMQEMPLIEVHRVPSTEPPGGVGEPGTPPIAPAVANAVFAATGKPVRRLPIRLTT